MVRALCLRFPRFPCFLRVAQAAAPRWILLLVLLVPLVPLAAIGCGGGTREPGAASTANHTSAPLSANIKTGCIDRFDAAADYFPEKLTVEESRIFTVEYHASYKVVSLGKAYPDGAPERYVLLQCGAPAPALNGDLASATVISIPIMSLFSSSTTHLPLLVDLDRLDVLTGVSKFDAITSPPVVARIKAGKVIEFASKSVIDAELIVAHHPGLLMAAANSPAFPHIRDAGIPIVGNVEWQEPTALGRAEWVKYMALFLNEERKAAQRFDAVKQAYQRLAARTREIPDRDRPRVMTGRAMHGTFTIAGGRSYVARMIEDAGGHYIWDDNTATGSAMVDLEAQVQRAADADIWINGGAWKNLPDMLSNEPRYAELKSYRQGQVWVYDLSITTPGANDYWSRSITRPDLILADLIKIFHPDLLPDHQFEWYAQVPRK
jgi:iron complex transport system substrate-binding protein